MILTSMAVLVLTFWIGKIFFDLGKIEQRLTSLEQKEEKNVNSNLL